MENVVLPKIPNSSQLLFGVLYSDVKQTKSLVDVNHKNSLLVGRIGSDYSRQDFLPFSLIPSKTHSHILSLYILYRSSFFLCLFCTSAACSVIVSDKVFQGDIHVQNGYEVFGISSCFFRIVLIIPLKVLCTCQ